MTNFPLHKEEKIYAKIIETIDFKSFISILSSDTWSMAYKINSLTLGIVKNIVGSLKSSASPREIMPFRRDVL